MSNMYKIMYREHYGTDALHIKYKQTIYLLLPAECVFIKNGIYYLHICFTMISSLSHTVTRVIINR